MAAKTFEQHVVTKEGPGRWLCSRAESNSSSFRVVFSPGVVIVHGDLGDLILECRDRNPASWLRRAVDSGYPDYPLSKAPHVLRMREFDETVADKVVEDLRKEEPEQASELKEKLRFVDRGDERAWLEAYADAVEDHDELPDVTDWSANALWCWHALRWLVASVGPELVEPDYVRPAW